jgi:16S rRNA (cytosine967-C5)-methyltransferase
MKTSRSLALAALQRWRMSGEFADRIVADLFSQNTLIPADRAFALELFYGVLRNLRLLDFWIARLRPAPVDSPARDLLRLGLYQLFILEIASHAAVFETVELARPHARGLINALLRRALREKAELQKAAETQSLGEQFSEPEFLVEKWTRQFGDEAAAALCRWNNQPAPVYARVNPLKIDAADFLVKYPGSISLPKCSQFVTLPEPAAALANGDCYIQDPSTIIPCALLVPEPGDVVLDACAAPGGKSAVLAAMMKNRRTLTVADRDESRLERLRGNLVRLGVINFRAIRCDWREADSIAGTGLAPASFDKILLDAPCSNTGVMRRRVDVRWRLRPEDFPRMRAQQLAMLRNLSQFLKPGGTLVYSTCSIEPEENEEVIAAFLSGEGNFRLTKTEKSLPWRDGFDGAYAAGLCL